MPDAPALAPGFSVVVPLFNKGPHIDRAIRSALDQTVPVREIIVVDDGSSDDGPARVAAIADPRVRFHVRGVPGPGGYAARNLGIDQATSAWIAFLDADDAWQPGHIATLQALVDRYEGVGCVFTGYDMHDPSGAVRTRGYARSLGEHGPRTVSFAAFLRAWIADKDPPIWTGAVAFRREVLQSAGLFPEGRCRRGGDKDLWLRAMAQTTAAFDPTPSAIYYRDAVNMVTSTTRICAKHCVVETIAALLAHRDGEIANLLKKVSDIETLGYTLSALRTGRPDRQIYETFYHRASSPMFNLLRLSNPFRDLLPDAFARYLQNSGIATYDDGGADRSIQKGRELRSRAERRRPFGGARRACHQRLARVRIATQMLSVIVMSRLLSPSDFGVVAMSSPVIAFIALFQNLGLSNATIQNKSISHDSVNFLFWINVFVSGGLGLALVAIAPLVALFFGDARVGPLVAAIGAIVFVQGLGLQHQALVNRRMEYHRLALSEGLSSIAGLAVSIGAAVALRSYWAIYFGTLAQALVVTIGYWWSSRWRPGRPDFPRAHLHLVKFGAGITGFNLANYFARNLDNILIGKFWNSYELGAYDRAYKLLLFPISQIANPLGRVMLPSLSRMNDDPARYRSFFLTSAFAMIFCVNPVISMMIVYSKELIPFLLGAKWIKSAEIFQLLGFAGIIQSLNNPAGWLFMSQGRTTEFFNWGLVTAAVAILAFVIGLPYGALGVAGAYAVSEYLKTPFLWAYLCRKGHLRLGDFLCMALPTFVGTHIALVALYLVRARMPVPLMVEFALAVLLSYAVVLVVAAASARNRAIIAALARGLARKLRIA